jgi:sortase A
LALWIRGYDQTQVFRAEGTKELDAARLSAGLSSLAEPSAPSGTPRKQGAKGSRAVPLDRGVLGRIEIPRLGISALIAEGTEPRQLDQAVGHIASSAFPGQEGNCALAGHRDSFLRGLGKVREKDLIRIDTPRDTYTYQVEWGSVVKPEQVDVLDRTREPSLTLVTCYPFQVIGPAPERFVVRAKLIESTD